MSPLQYHPACALSAYYTPSSRFNEACACMLFLPNVQPGGRYVDARERRRSDATSQWADLYANVLSFGPAVASSCALCSCCVLNRERARAMGSWRIGDGAYCCARAAQGHSPQAHSTCPGHAKG
jgi:hypothetical protein